MKHIKPFNPLDKYYNMIEGTYTKNSDETIDIVGNVIMIHEYFWKLPIKFNKVSGNFNCFKNKLTSLEGSPKEVGGEFDCSNNNITSLEGPKIVGSTFYCSENKLTSLKGGPVEVGDRYRCHKNLLTNLIGAPDNIQGDFDCYVNNLTSLEGCPKTIGGDLDIRVNNIWNFYGIGDVSGIIYCKSNPIDEVFQLCPTNEFVRYLNEFRPIRGKTILGKRLQECLYMCDKEVDLSTLSFNSYKLLE